jgi:hypothetical protein
MESRRVLEGNMMLHHLYGRLSNRVPYGGYWMERTMKILRYKPCANISIQNTRNGK